MARSSEANLLWSRGLCTSPSPIPAPYIVLDRAHEALLTRIRVGSLDSFVAANQVTKNGPKAMLIGRLAPDLNTTLLLSLVPIGRIAYPLMRDRSSGTCAAENDSAPFSIGSRGVSVAKRTAPTPVGTPKASSTTANGNRCSRCTVG
jgi:hypothetical protein